MEQVKHPSTARGGSTQRHDRETFVGKAHLPVAPPRSRFRYGLASLVVTLAGLASRRYAPRLPDFVAAYAGDTLWALLVFLLAGFVWTWAPSRRLAVGAAVFALGIELSQMNHSPWLERLQSSRFGALVLGADFFWIDLICYAVGIVAGLLLDRWLRHRPASLHSR
ncbi:MAG: DUF2809 domain-containing protein [Gemmatimonadota bacterium]